MRRFALFVLFCGVFGSSLALASPASANTTVNIKMRFAEPAVNPDCAVTNGFCGQGVVLPLGPATETIEFGAACGGACVCCAGTDCAVALASATPAIRSSETTGAIAERCVRVTWSPLGDPTRE